MRETWERWEKAKEAHKQEDLNYNKLTWKGSPVKKYKSSRNLKLTKAQQSSTYDEFTRARAATAWY